MTDYINLVCLWNYEQKNKKVYSISNYKYIDVYLKCLISVKPKYKLLKSNKCSISSFSLLTIVASNVENRRNHLQYNKIKFYIDTKKKIEKGEKHDPEYTYCHMKKYCEDIFVLLTIPIDIQWKLYLCMFVWNLSFGVKMANHSYIKYIQPNNKQN